MLPRVERSVTQHRQIVRRRRGSYGGAREAGVTQEQFRAVQKFCSSPARRARCCQCVQQRNQRRLVCDTVCVRPRICSAIHRVALVQQVPRAAAHPQAQPRLLQRCVCCRPCPRRRRHYRASAVFLSSLPRPTPPLRRGELLQQRLRLNRISHLFSSPPPQNLASKAPDSPSATPRSSAPAPAPARPHTAQGFSPLSIVVGCGERQSVHAGRKMQQQKYAQDLANQIQSKSEMRAAAAPSNQFNTSLLFQPSESALRPAYPRERCPFLISKQVFRLVFVAALLLLRRHVTAAALQEYKQQLLNQISERVRVKQQQQQQDKILHQKSLYCAAPPIASNESGSKSSAVRPPPPAGEATSHNLPLGVRSFLDDGNGQSLPLPLLRRLVFFVFFVPCG